MDLETFGQVFINTDAIYQQVPHDTCIRSQGDFPTLLSIFGSHNRANQKGRPVKNPVHCKQTRNIEDRDSQFNLHICSRKKMDTCVELKKLLDALMR
jgi:hypothetical protein